MAGVMDGIFITLAESVLKWKGETLSVGKAGDILGSTVSVLLCGTKFFADSQLFFGCGYLQRSD